MLIVPPFKINTNPFIWKKPAEKSRTTLEAPLFPDWLIPLLHGFIELKFKNFLFNRNSFPKYYL